MLKVLLVIYCFGIVLSKRQIPIALLSTKVGIKMVHNKNRSFYQMVKLKASDADQENYHNIMFSIEKEQDTTDKFKPFILSAYHDDCIKVNGKKFEKGQKKILMSKDFIELTNYSSTNFTFHDLRKFKETRYSSDLMRDYFIGGTLGQGVSGFTYLVHNVHTLEMSAMKLAYKSKRTLTDYAAEAKIHSKLNHPNIVQLLRVHDEIQYSVMYTEFMDCNDLLQLIMTRPHQRLFEDEARNYFGQVAEGLKYLHEQNICHRDIKCDNIFVGKEANGYICKIGAIFHDDNDESEIAFRYAIKRINMYETSFELEPLVRHVSSYDSFKTERIVCELVNEGVAAIFGPGTMPTSGITSSICSTVEIPHIITHWERETIGSMTDEESSPFTLNLYPETNMLSRAYADLLMDYTWKSYTIIYEDDDSLIRLKDILQIHDPQSSPVTVRQLGDGPDYRPLLKQIQTSGESHIIIDVSNLDIIITLLRQASEVKMMEEYQSYIITSLDTHTLDFEELKFMRANITAMRLIDPSSYDLSNAIHDWEIGERQNNKMYRVAPESVKVQTALYHDAVRLFAAAVRELDATEEIETEKINCKQAKQWEHGKRIAEYMRLRTDNGITGRIVFNDEGKRAHFQLEITELSKDGFKKIGTWDPEHQVNYTRTLGEAYEQVIEALQNKTFIVVSRVAAPFLDYRKSEDGETFEGNQRFQGYSLDLIDAISKILHFNYKFEIVPDGKYGSYNKITKQWDGLVKHLLDRKADLAICDLTITYERRTAVDFTMPFMTLGISILFLKPVKQPPNLFSFLSPLSVDVWVYMLAAYLGVSVLLFVLSRMAPDDWESSHPCNQEPEELENIWNMQNCIWLTMGSIMGQGCDILPKAISTRIVACMWWFFALIMLASYTANLAAFLTMERMDATINSAEDLAKQSKIKYGAVKGGSTMKFFQESNFSTYQRMWAAMESARPTVFVNNNDEGRDRVLKGKRQYAYLMESTMLEYFTERYCELTQIGGLLDSKSYGIALPLNSPYRTAISGAVLKLQEDGKLSALKEKWWKGGMCQKSESGGSDDAAELGIDAVGGVFVVLGFGCLFALVVAIFEFLWNVKKVAVEQKLTPWEALRSELLFAVNIWITIKPVRNRLSESESPKSTSRSQKSSRYGSEVHSSKEKSVRSVNLNNGKANGFTSRSLSHLNRIGKFFIRKNNSD